MSKKDYKRLDRTAQRLWLDYKIATGTPPVYPDQWRPAYAAGIDSVQINSGPRSSLATVTFPSLRWNEKYANKLTFGDRVRIYKPASSGSDEVTIFSGFVTREISEFSGGTDKSAGYERCSLALADHRWLLTVGTCLYGQRVRGVDDYNNFGTISQSPYALKSTFLSGRRCVFNEGGRANADPLLLAIKTSDVTSPDGNYFLDDGVTHSYRLFDDDDRSIYWTARDMIYHVTGIFKNSQYNYAPLNYLNMTGLTDVIFDTVLHDISVEGLNILEALTAICDPLGVSFREDYSPSGDFQLTFYKLGSASSDTRSTTAPTITHELYAPQVGEDISDAVSRGEKMVKSASLDRDISSSVTRPIGLGGRMRFEFTAELIPAFLDSDVHIDDASSYANVFLTDETLAETVNPNSLEYYAYHHCGGLYYRCDAARKWALNESGKYSVSPAWQIGRDYPTGFIVSDNDSFYRCLKNHLSTSSNKPAERAAAAIWVSIEADYDRGKPFDFTTVIDKEYITDANGKRIYAAIKKQLLSSLSVVEGSGSSAGVSVEFSFDSGTSWQTIPCAIYPLDDEFGIRIAEPNLANIHPDKVTTFTSGDLIDKDINLFSSIADDIIAERVFKDGDWHTRVRVTASVQLDNRIYFGTDTDNAPGYGSPFNQYRVYDFSSSYGLGKRDSSSRFYQQGKGAAEYDQRSGLQGQLKSIRDANKGLAVSGIFILERLWLDDSEIFKVGDCITKIAGRDFDLSTSITSDQSQATEIIQISYDIEKQTQTLITRDLKFSRPQD